MSGPDLSHLLEPVARRLCGEPSPLSTPDMLHFGANGSLWVDLAMHQWGDSEDTTAGGDVLALVAYRTGRLNGGCEAWLTDHGFTLEPIKIPYSNGNGSTAPHQKPNGNDSDRNTFSGGNGKAHPGEPSPLINLELEQALLGAVLLDGASIHGLSAVLPEHFSEPLHRRLWDIMREMAQSGRTPSPVTIAPYLPTVQVAGGMTTKAYVAALAAGTIGLPAADIAKTVIDLGQLRQLQTIGQEIAEGATAGDPGASPKAQIAEAIVKLTALSSEGLRPTQRASTAGQAAKDVVADMEHPEARQKPVSTGYVALDRIIGGYRRGCLDILAGRPGMGKSTIAAASGLRLAWQKQGVIFFSMEMTKPQLVARLISDQVFQYTRPLVYSDILDGVVKEEHRPLVKQAAREIADLPFVIDPQPGLSIAEIAVRASRYIEAMMKRGIVTALVIIDHLGKIRRPMRANDNVELGQVTSRAAEVAKELDTCVLMLCQLNRMVENREDTRPRLSDLRESGHVEEDADCVLMVYRQHYYEAKKPKPTEPDKANGYEHRLLQMADDMDVLVTKNRHGRDGTAKLWCHMGAARIQDRDVRG